MLTKILAAIIAVLTAGLLLFYNLYSVNSELAKSSAKEIAELEARVYTLEQTAIYIRENVQELSKRDTKLEARLSDAIKEHSTWSNDTVPLSIIDSLCSEIECSSKTR